MAGSRIGAVVSLVRQGLELGIDYGPHSVEALLWVAETIQESVYRAGSLRVDRQGLRFDLGNPPLRAGAFCAVRLGLDGRAIASDRVLLRPGPGTEWRAASGVSADVPIDLVAGVPIELRADGERPPPGTSITVRLELECRAIPPLVWVEFTETVRSE